MDICTQICIYVYICIFHKSKNVSEMKENIEWSTNTNDIIFKDVSKHYRNKNNIKQMKVLDLRQCNSKTEFT